jgi:hypothetical protein
VVPLLSMLLLFGAPHFILLTEMCHASHGVCQHGLQHGALAADDRCASWCYACMQLMRVCNKMIPENLVACVRGGRCMAASITL